MRRWKHKRTINTVEKSNRHTPRAYTAPGIELSTSRVWVTQANHYTIESDSLSFEDVARLLMTIIYYCHLLYDIQVYLSMLDGLDWMVPYVKIGPGLLVPSTAGLTSRHLHYSIKWADTEIAILVYWVVTYNVELDDITKLGLCG